MSVFLRYIKERRACIAAFFGGAAVYTAVIALYGLPAAVAVYPFAICFSAFCAIFVRGFCVLRKRHGELAAYRPMIDDAPEPKTLPEEDILAAAIRLCGQIKADKAEAEARARDAEEYFTVWAHQIKTPISAARLLLQNEDTALSRALYSELMRISQYVDMAMTYRRLDSETTDYVFRTLPLDGLIKGVLRSFSHEFIARKLALDYSGAEGTVVTDEKWFSFVVGQIISNALKYTRTGGIKIFMRGSTLCIADTGIGIDSADLPRIFEKGYTGINGRCEGSSTGIGLYLCRRVCDNLGIGISAVSEPERGTEIRLQLDQYELHFE